MLKVINVLLAGATCVLQGQIWLGENSVPAYGSLNQRLEQMQAEMQHLSVRNQMLKSEVIDLKTSSEAIEERARTDLGLIKQGETFYFISPEKA